MLLKATVPTSFEINGGTINKAGQSLICLPNRFLVKIEGGGDEIDAVTY
ncbi:MAG: NusG domain II-containing protein [Clostridiales bacterium]|nr:MAG: NusG domain II-containing protein [Clostridiales bacterium]